MLQYYLTGVFHVELMPVHCAVKYMDDYFHFISRQKD